MPFGNLFRRFLSSLLIHTSYYSSVNQVLKYYRIFHSLISCHMLHILRVAFHKYVASVTTTKCKGMYTIGILILIRSKLLITYCIPNLYRSNIYPFDVLI